MTQITIDGRAVRVEGGLPLLEALTRAGVHIPHMCHDARLKPAGLCRLCLVEVDGYEHPVISCTLPVTEGMGVRTQGPALEKLRRGVLQLMTHHLPAVDVQLEREACQPLTRELVAHGLAQELSQRAPSGAADATHPYIHVDLSRCIHCGRCERICDEVEGRQVWSVWERGDHVRMVPDSGTTLRASTCVSCGACADSCPSGALEDHSLRALGTPERFTRTTCAYCGVGCELMVGTRAGRIVQARPALDAPANKGHACVKGRYAFEFVRATDRLTRPLIRDAGGLREVSFEQAIAFVAERLRAIGASYGPDAVGVLGSARATNEENYLIQKFARVVLQTNNVDCCARVCHGPSAAALGAMLGTGAATSCFDDIELAQTIVVVGSNTTQNHPVVGARIRQAALRGAHLIVIDPRGIELCAVASVHLAARPGTNVPLLHAMARVILEEGLEDRSFLTVRVDGLADYRRAVDAWTLERAADTCGVAAEDIARAARLYASAGPAISFHGLGLTEHVQGTEGVMALINLALITGNLGRPGSGVNPLRGQNNVQGSAQMGCTPTQLTGAVPVAAAPEAFARVWGSAPPSRPGLDWMQMVDAADAGRLKALYAVGYDVLLSNPNAHVTRRALEKLELLVVQDIFLNETARALAHVVLPVACAFEKEGTFMSAERRVQRVRKAVAAPEGVLDDAQVVSALAAALGHTHGFSHASASEIWDEVRAVWPAAAGMTYARLEQPGGLQWPCPSEDHPGSQRLHQVQFSKSRRTNLMPIAFRPSAEQTDAGYPYLLVTGRLLYQFNAATMTGRTRNQELQPTDVLRIAPADAAREGWDQGTRVRVESRYGDAVLPLEIDPAQRLGELFCTFHDAQVAVNHVTSHERDNLTHTPEYKRTAVRLSRVHPYPPGPLAAT